ncbi:DNA polymerase III subunit gamma/tau [Acuticoccus sediminis]|uniref:DNA polymerase III subunit gamma/tau n=1 Tax=Acuticoccus sediminis TaxID=2184697 RepID=UPI001CFDD2C1|nr:DNA polymerase III subunit gamma/tau [Acuticoccus sediminis]
MSDSTAPSATPYTVLARKYRPTHFGELIGQAPMVRTLRNAFAHDRIPQAWMLTGVRGVGKTTTARILARALNYEKDGTRRPTVEFTEFGDHCKAIMEGRHVDVIEMDAASHTSINDIREITDAARYKPVSALYKVYIIDEVHMLSTAAFNGLLKTLEEPPEHVKFIFATTEIRKVPVTVLSRCQRFDLRRIEAGELTGHLKSVAVREGITAEDEALRLIARAAEGSVRDSLSLMDQAISHGGGVISAESLRDMLGLADRTRIVDLFELIMKGDPAGALAELAAQYEVGADPAVILSDLAAFTHQVTRLKVTNGEPDPGEPQEVRERSVEFAAGLGMAALSRMWQALLTGIQEVQSAPKPLMAAEMVLIRLTYMASLPDPDRLPLSDAPQAPGGPPARAPGVPRTPARDTVASAPPQQPQNFADVAALMGSHSLILKQAVEQHMRLKSFAPGRIEVSLTENANAASAGQLGQKLTEITGARWIVSVSDGSTAPTIHEVRTAEQIRLKAEAGDDPLVKAILERFSDAEIVEVRETTQGAEPPAEQARDRKG